MAKNGSTAGKDTPPKVKLTGEDLLAATKKKADAQTAKSTAIQKAITGKPLAEKEVSSAEKALVDHDAAGKLLRSDLSRKRDALKHIRMTLRLPAVEKDDAVEQLPAEPTEAPQSEASAHEQAPDVDADEAAPTTSGPAPGVPA